MSTDHGTGHGADEYAEKQRLLVLAQLLVLPLGLPRAPTEGLHSSESPDEPFFQTTPTLCNGTIGNGCLNVLFKCIEVPVLAGLHTAGELAEEEKGEAEARRQGGGNDCSRVPRECHQVRVDGDARASHCTLTAGAAGSGCQRQGNP